LIGVSDAYLDTLRHRYSWIDEQMCTTLPFGVARSDFELLDRHPQTNGVFEPRNGEYHGVSVGRGGPDLRRALTLLFNALHMGLAKWPDTFGPVRTHFVGTAYATDARATETIRPVAVECGVGAAVTERPLRVPYFEGLQLMRDADFLLLIGSDDPAYTASKAYPYLMTGRPVLAVLHERSPLCRELSRIPWVALTTFGDGSDNDAACRLLMQWKPLLDGRLNVSFDPSLVEPFSAREMTRRQCEAFDRAMTTASRTVHP
jgi:hypothetical protein